MSWLKIDDGFAAHPKIAQLSDREFRTWMRLLCYAARYKIENGDVATALNEVVGVTEKFIERCVALKLVDVTESGEKVIHDWSKYQPKDPTAAERQQKRRDSNVTPSVTDQTVTNAVTVTERSGGEYVTPYVTAPSRARASRPVPSVIESSIEDSLAPPAAAQKRPGRKKREKKEHPPGHNEVFALVGKVLRQQPSNEHEYGFWHNYIAQIHQSLIAGGFQPEQWEEEIRRVCRVLFARWGNDASGINPQSLAKWWASCAPEAGFTADEFDYPAWVNDLPSELGCVVREFPVSKVWKDKPGWWVEDVESGVLDVETLRFRLGRRP